MTFKLLDAVDATGAGPSQRFRRIVEQHSVEITITGAPTSVTVDLEGSLDGVSWSQLGQLAFSAGELAAGFAMFHVVEKPVDYVRLNVTALAGGTAPTVTGYYSTIERIG